MNYNDAIKEVTYLGRSVGVKDNAFHIAFSGTSNYLVHIGVTIYSILASNEENAFHFHLFMNDVGAEDKKRLENLVHQFQCKITIYYVNDSFFKELIRENAIAAAYYRFIIPPIVAKEDVKKVLYLDGDIMCQGNLKELLTCDITNNIAACVQDTSPQYAKMRAKIIHSKEYFNSGVMLINIQQWIENKISEKAMKLAIKWRQQGDFRILNDQDILNVLLMNKFILVSGKYNYIYHMDMKSIYQKQVDLVYTNEAVLIHFAGLVKPWRTWVQDLPGVQKYALYREKSPWREVSLIPIKSHKDMHQAARHKRRMHKYGESISLYLEYLHCKIKGRK